jgi:hypothetical protein
MGGFVGEESHAHDSSKSCTNDLLRHVSKKLHKERELLSPQERVHHESSNIGKHAIFLENILVEVFRARLK